VLRGDAGAVADAGDRKAARQLDDVSLDGREGVFVASRVKSASDKSGNGPHLLRSHAARGEGRRSQANTAALEGRALVVGDGVAVGGDVGLLQPLLSLTAADPLDADIDEQEVVVGATRDEAEAVALQRLGKSLRVVDDLL
jgi:hypothetical protein